ncbi:translation repressor RelE [Francisella halioticida]|uniref:type II toxin-antitoxin system RelE family toxin n=1 Tax=Francisella halioticida TaxID=549298 RepID=UPI001AFB3FE0|nr:type II toxin-antitoxin system RelE/ParE family toxin [Francisella halioticida]BCD92275.1 translation repressor RelE [Francisella halioticida]
MWKISWSNKARKQLTKLDIDIQKQIAKFIDEKLILCSEPQTLGKRLSGATLGKFYRFRIGDYRLICDVQKQSITITVLKIGHRKEVYRG